MEALNIEEIAKKATNVVKMSPKGSEADFEKRLKENKKKAKAKEANDIIEDYSNQQAELMEKFNIENNIPDLFYVVKSAFAPSVNLVISSLVMLVFSSCSCSVFSHENGKKSVISPLQFV